MDVRPGVADHAKRAAPYSDVIVERFANSETGTGFTPRGGRGSFVPLVLVVALWASAETRSGRGEKDDRLESLSHIRRIADEV
jgi:hypothetical protein